MNEATMADKSFNNVFNFGVTLISFCILGWVWQTGGCQISREFMSDAERYKHRYDEEPAEGLPVWWRDADLDADGKLSDFERTAYEEDQLQRNVDTEAP